jgi:RNA polymerase sigma factor (sigma-70 family)
VTKLKVEEILDGIRQNDVEILQYVYKTFYPQVKYFIKVNSGVEDDAQDIFQEAIIIIFRKLKNEQLNISCTFNTYLYSVCKLLWLKQLEKRKAKKELSIDKGNYIELPDDTQVMMEYSERYRLYQDYFKKLSNDCRKVLELSLQKVPLKKIAVIMGYKSEKYAKKRKFTCKEKLIENIKSDPKFKELM